jgi:hypothetical protein
MSGPAASSGAYSAEETLIVNQALRTHRDTTQAAERALKVRWCVCGERRPPTLLVSRFSSRLLSHRLTSTQTANRTKEVAAATLGDLERQGDQLGRVRGDLNTVRERERES